MGKFCPTCELEKDLTEFSKNKTKKDGFQRECKECCRKHNKKHYHTKKSPKLNEELKKDHKICSYCINELPLKFFVKQKGGRFGCNSKCKDCRKIANNIWRNKGGKDWENQYQKQRKKSDPIFKLKYLIRLRVNEVLKKENITKKHNGLKYLGCNALTYKTHLEEKFTKYMNWDNHGIYWEVDHVKPLDLIKSESDCFLYFNYKNTQPLTVEDNRSKGNKV